MHYLKMYFLIAENVAKQWKISRQNQDEFALSSQNQAEKAQKDGHFNDELISIPVKIRKGKYSIITLYQLNRSPGQNGMKAEVMVAFLACRLKMYICVGAGMMGRKREK